MRREQGLTRIKRKSKTESSSTRARDQQTLPFVAKGIEESKSSNSKTGTIVEEKVE